MIRLIPSPRKTDMTDARVAVAPVYTADAAFADAAATLADYARRTHSITLTEGDGGVTFTVDEALPTEAYVLTVTKSGAAVKASDVLGAQNAAVTLIQLMEKEGDGLTLPEGTIEDEPQCTWRTVMIDLARDWHELQVLYEYVDMCRFYKVKYLHLHFTDDQSYTLPSRAFPKLPTEGRHYTEEEIKGVIAYAKSRGVQLIPEIDVPGHTTSFAAAYGEIFGRDGINWVVVRDTEEFDCGCRNITIRNCRLQKKRDIGIAISLNYDTYARSYYPGCVCVPQSGITLDNIVLENDVDILLHSTYPSENITLKNIDFKNSKLCFDTVAKADKIIYPEVEINTENVVFNESTVQTNPKHPIRICFTE